MNKRLTVSAFGFALVGLGAASLVGGPLPHDERILTGKLDNGVTWMFRQHDNPPGKMALMMHVRTGSLNESEAQRGLAHFMEHMMFNGTEHFAPGELIKFFESIGMEFGADLNASTSFERTVYLLFTPDAKTETLDKTLMTLSDYAFRALLSNEEIDKERGVILEELRTGQDYQERLRDKLWPELFEGSRLAQRLPIGKEEVIAHAPRSEFEAYYRAWYRPENITVILAGDAKADDVVPLIKKWFSEYRAQVPGASQERAEFKPFTRERAIVVTDPELVQGSIELFNLGPRRPPTVTSEQWRQELVERIGSWIFGRRCEERLQKGEASYLQAGASIMDMFHDGLLVVGSAEGEPKKWETMLEELVMEINRAREFGFNQRELDLAKKEILADAEEAVRQEPTRNARRVGFAMVSAVNNQEPVLSAQQELDLLQEMLPGVQLPQVNETFAGHFKPGSFAYVLELPESAAVKVPPRDDVLAAARAAWARKLEAPKVEDVPTDLLAKLPEPGKVVESAVDKDLQITSAWLENGVRVHHRFMDYKKDLVMVSISLAGGVIEETAKNVGVTEVAGLAVNQAATSRLTSTNVRDLMTGKNIQVSAASGVDDAFTLTVSGSPKDLETGLQLAHALLTDGKIEASAFDKWKRARIQEIEQNQTNLFYKTFEVLQDLLSGGDPRRLVMTKEKVEAVDPKEAQTWFDRLCHEAPIEVAVVGDLNLEEAMPLIQKYVGSLPARKRSTEHLDGLRRLGRNTGPLKRQVKVETISPQAVAMAGFVGCEGRQHEDARALQVAANILSSRLIKHVREELSLVYSIRAMTRPSWIYRDSGLFQAGSMCDPDNADRLADEIHKTFQAFVDSGPTAEELENAKLQIANNLDTEMREPRYWWGILEYLGLHGRSLDEEKREKEAYARMTAEEVQTAFKKYYTPERSFTVTAVPTKVETQEKAKEEKPAPTSQPAS
ncbi:MAG: insulinase family protein [Planctomycetota bacterium]